MKDMLIIDAKNTRVINDNHHRGVVGHAANGSDNTEFLHLSLDNSVPEPGNDALATAGMARRGTRA